MKDDAELMKGVARGDDAALAELIGRHQRGVLNFFVRCGVYTDEQEDLVQETFLRVYRYRARYRPSAKFTTFLYLLARQVRIDALRRRQRREARHREADKELPHSVVPTETERGGVMDVMAALARLSEEMRETVALVVMQGMTHDEAAAVLKIPAGTVKSRLFHAMGIMRKFMESDKL